jgi:glycosyltransferase involved in cell wall biosynthesis
MRILHFIYALAPGGAERFVVDLCNEMILSGNEVYLYTLRDDAKGDNGFYKSELSNRIRYKSLKIEEGFSLFNSYLLAKIIINDKPDVVHCHLNLVNYLFPLTLIFKKIKFYHTIHSDPPKEVSGKIEYWIRKVFYKSKRMNAITISEETSKSFVKYYKTKKFTQIYNGRKRPIPSKDFKLVKDYITSLKEKGSTIFIHVGRCVTVKNQKMLISVFNLLQKEGNLVKLLIIGEGFNSSLGKELKSFASENILFIDAVHNIADYFLNADAFCLSSTYEGMPITLIEALACGCTPICTPVGGIKDSIENGVTGFLSKTISEADYYEAIISYLNKKTDIEKEKLIESYNKKFSIEECVYKYIELYKKNAVTRIQKPFIQN